MNTNNPSRRTALKYLLAGSAVSLIAGCDSLPRAQGGSSTDGSELAIKVRDALRNHPYTSQLMVDVSSKGDEVIIKGFVSSQNDVANVELVANQVDGVRHAIIDLFIRK